MRFMGLLEAFGQLVEEVNSSVLVGAELSPSFSTLEVAQNVAKLFLRCGF